jgi:16S rRNA processing protein RimM
MDVLEPEWVIVGKFGRPQGIKGFVRVISFTEPSDNILQYPDWFIQKKDNTWQHVKRLDTQVSPKYLCVQIDGYPSREAIAELTHASIAVPASALPQLSADEYYWHELIGMQVKHHTGIVMGEVDSILKTGANDVLVVIDNQHQKRRLIPYLLDDVIQSINKNSREITVCWDLDF